MGPETWLVFFVPDPWRTGDGGGVDVARRIIIHVLHRLKRIFLAVGNRTGAPVLVPFTPCSRPVLLERAPVERPVYGKSFLTRTVYIAAHHTITHSVTIYSTTSHYHTQCCYI